ncbi:hypothetical protein C0J52_16440 [Blattella germanica]|nr:hypothetical protein C0J52_16440 [Blattella germanica]
MYQIPLFSSANPNSTPLYYQSMLKSFPAPVFNSTSGIMTSPFLMDNLLNTKFEHQQNGTPPNSENMEPRKLLERDSRGLITCPIPPKDPSTVSYFNGSSSPGGVNGLLASKQQGQLDSSGLVTSRLLSPHQEALGPTATASLTLGITASYSIVAQDSHGLSTATRHHPPAIVTCTCGGSDDCCAGKRDVSHALSYFQHQQPGHCANNGCCCYERRGDSKTSLKQDSTTSQAKPILKFSVSAILGADSVKSPTCTGMDYDIA